MTGSAFYTRPQWLSDEHIAHSHMQQTDGSRVDAVRNLDKGSPGPHQPGKNPVRSFIDYAGDGGPHPCTPRSRPTRCRQSSSTANG